jgi:hypothetical protein
MKPHVGWIVFALACLVLPASVELLASEMIGIYAMVDRVVFEPNGNSPERIQIWGSFITNRDQTAKRGYMYFRLPGLFQPQEANEAAKKEWADIKAAAKTGQVIGFGRRFYPYIQHEQADEYYKTLGRVRSAAEKPESPEPYPVNIGLSKVADPGTARKLLEAPAK